MNKNGKSTCCTCGYEWKTGTDGSHWCREYLAKTVTELKATMAHIDTIVDSVFAATDDDQISNDMAFISGLISESLEADK